MRATNTFKNRGSNATINLTKSPQAAKCPNWQRANAQRALDWCVVVGVLAIASCTQRFRVRSSESLGEVDPADTEPEPTG